MERARANRLLGRVFAVAALSAFFAPVACTSHPAPRPESSVRTAKKQKPNARGGGPLALVTAVDMITSERCNHEGECHRLGAGRRFRDYEACQKELVHEARSQLRTAVCETGFVEPASVLECLESIRNGGCTAQLTAACEPATMCSP